MGRGLTYVILAIGAYLVFRALNDWRRRRIERGIQREEVGNEQLAEAYERGRVVGWKLQVLVYYCQAWSLVWEGRVLFRHGIKAWGIGPVCPALYEKHRGSFKVERLGVGDPGRLTVEQRDTVDVVVGCYGGRKTNFLTRLARLERPWVEARGGLLPGERGNSTISRDAMAEYYGGL